MLKRYWFKFVNISEAGLPLGVSAGCGVSAYDYNDATVLITEKIFKNNVLPTLEEVIEDIDVSTLDKGHVLPNMGDVTLRGIWFPLGYV